MARLHSRQSALTDKWPGRPASIHRMSRSLAFACAVLLASCGSPAAEPAKSTPAPAPAAPNANAAVEAMLKSLGAAIVAKDYAAAYAFIASDARADITSADFQEALEAYLDRYEGALQVAVRVEPYDPEGSSLVPDALKGRIVSEGTIEFLPGGDEEGFTMAVWILMESGAPKLATFFVGD